MIKESELLTLAYSVARRECKNYDDVPDVASECAIQAWLTLPKIDHALNPRSYIHKVMQTRARRYLCSLSKEPRSIPLTATIISQYCFDLSEMQIVISQFAQTLNKRDRTILMGLLADTPLTEIARQLNIRYATLITYINRNRQTWINQLNEKARVQKPNHRKNS